MTTYVARRLFLSLLVLWGAVTIVFLAVRVVPGDPAHSLISLRMHVNDSDRMPPVARHVVDAQGAALVDAWISSLTACP